MFPVYQRVHADSVSRSRLEMFQIELNRLYSMGNAQAIQCFLNQLLTTKIDIYAQLCTNDPGLSYIYYVRQEDIPEISIHMLFASINIVIENLKRSPHSVYPNQVNALEFMKARPHNSIQERSALLSNHFHAVKHARQDSQHNHTYSWHHDEPIQYSTRPHSQHHHGHRQHSRLHSHHHDSNQHLEPHYHTSRGPK